LKLKLIKTLTCAKATTENTDFVEGSLWINFCDAASMYDSIFTEGGGAKKMIDGLAIDGEAGLTISNHNLAIRVDTQEFTHVTLL
jgi:hypothetical protein